MLKSIKIKESFIICPKNRVYEYLLFSDYIFKQTKINFFNEFKEVDNQSNDFFIDIKYLDKFIDYKFKYKPNSIICILWNGNIDYLINEKKITNAKKKFKKLILLGPCNLLNEGKKYTSLDKFEITNTPKLKNVRGISYLKKLKYFFPTIFSIYNFIKYLPKSLNFLGARIVFVGLGNKKDLFRQIRYLIDSEYTSMELKSWGKKILIKFEEKSKIFDLNSLDDVFKYKMSINEKYYALNLVIRYLFLDHLKNFNFFFHKTNSNDAFELLKTNFYKKIYQINLGSQHGNGNVNVRSLLLKKFYDKKNINFEFFKSEITYDEKKIFERLKTIKIFFEDFYRFDKFDCKMAPLLDKLHNLKNKLKN